MPRISVGVRVRPDGASDGGQKAPRRLENLAVSSDQRSIDFRVTETQHSFTFNRIFHEEASQISMYDGTMRNLVEGALDGYNGCIFAYGQTGAGKTYTMSGNLDGDDDSYGLVPRTALEMFRMARKSPDSSFSFRLSVLEIYNEVLFDLLVEQSDALPSIAFSSTVSRGDNNENNNNNKESKLNILELDSGVVVPNLRIMPIKSGHDAVRLLQDAQANRAIAEHQLNQRSSRSHVIYTYYVTRSANNNNNNSDNNNAADPIVHQSKLHLVDLAGSERVNKTGSVGTVQKEANYINRSLSYLEQVVLALTQSNRDHVPYRQSKLTHLVKDSLGGNCQTVLVACIWPRRDYAWETLSTMRFAARMKNIETNPVRNRLVSNDPSGNGSNGQGYVNGGQLRTLQLQVESLKRELVMRDFIHRHDKTTLLKQYQQNHHHHQQQHQASTADLDDSWLPDLTKVQRQHSSRNLLRYVLPVNREDIDEHGDVHTEPLPFSMAEDAINHVTPIEINSLSQAQHYIMVMKRALYIAAGYDDHKLRETLVQAVAAVHLSNPVPSSLETLQTLAATASSGGAIDVSLSRESSNSSNNNNQANPMLRRHEERFIGDILHLAGLVSNNNTAQHTNSSKIDDADEQGMDTHAVPLTARTTDQHKTPLKQARPNDRLNTFSPDSNNGLLQSNQKLKKEELFKEFTAAEGAGKDWQKAYDDAGDALKNAKSRQREIVSYLNANKADIDLYTITMQELTRKVQGKADKEEGEDAEENADQEDNEDRVVLSEVEKQEVAMEMNMLKEKLEEVKRNYRTAYQEMQICKEQIEEMHSLKKRTMTALLTAFDNYYRDLYQNGNSGNANNNEGDDTT